MTTRRLLWGMTWRGTLLGWLSGVLLAATYGIIVDLYLILTDPYFHIGNYQSILAESAILGYVGGAIGLSLGLCASFLMGILTRLCFFKLENPSQFRHILISISIVYVASAALLVFYALGYILSALASLGSPFHGLGLDTLILFVIVPTLIATSTAALASFKLTRWYEVEMQKKNAPT